MPLDGKQMRDGTVPPPKLCAPLSVAYASALSLDTALCSDFAIGALTGNLIVTLANPAAGRRGTIAVRQDATGGRTVQIIASGFVRYRDTDLANLDAGSAARAITLYSYEMSVVAGEAVLELGRKLLALADPLGFDGDHSDFLYDGDHTTVLTYG
jgi:hypothetical protein